MFSRRARLGLSSILGLGLIAALLWVLSGGLQLTDAQGPLYVALSGLDAGNNCQNPAAPCATLQRAVDVAAPGDEIRVAAGTYTGVQARAGVTQVVYISQSVTVRGGYTTTNNFAASDPIVNPTTLDAQGGGRVVFITGTVGTLENLAVTNGSVSAGGVTCPDAGCGGGIYANSALILTNVSVVTNTTTGGFGGGVYVAGAATLSGGLFERNTSTSGHGGGLFVAGALALADTQFISNTSNGLGGGALTFGAATLAGGLFERNTSTSGHGGGLFVAGTLTLTGAQFISNTAAGAGGGARAGGAATLIGGLFQGNTCTGGTCQGGGLVTFGSLALTGAQFISNTAALGGGAYSTGSDSRIQNSLFQGNLANDEGGGLFIDSAANVQLLANHLLDNQAVNGGGGLYMVGASLLLTNNVLAANTSMAGAAALETGGLSPSSVQGAHNTFAAGATGSAVAIGAGDDVVGDAITLTNSIMHGFAVGFQTGPFTSTLAANGLLWSEITTPTQGAGITVANAYTGSAAFVNEPARDYRLTAASDAIDRGVNAGVSNDIDGDARPFGSAPDLGADEFVDLAQFKLHLPLVMRSAAPAVAGWNPFPPTAVI